MGKLPQAYHELADYMRVCGDKRHPDDVLALILKEWLQDAVGGKDAGYQWGELYLPDGAELRLHFLGEWYYISVDSAARGRAGARGELVRPKVLLRNASIRLVLPRFASLLGLPRTASPMRKKSEKFNARQNEA